MGVFAEAGVVRASSCVPGALWASLPRPVSVVGANSCVPGALWRLHLGRQLLACVDHREPLEEFAVGESSIPVGIERVHDGVDLVIRQGARKHLLSGEKRDDGEKRNQSVWVVFFFFRFSLTHHAYNRPGL